MRPRFLKHAFAVAVALISCSKSEPTTKNEPKPIAAVEPVASQRRTLVSFVDELAHCDVEHRGLLVDLGTPALAGRTGSLDGPLPPSTEHHAATWTPITTQRFDLEFYLSEPQRIFVSANAIGRVAKNAVIQIDGHSLGTVKFNRDAVSTVTTPVSTNAIDAGNHTLSFRFRGKREEATAFAELDWIRIGFPDESTQTYGPPTLGDIFDRAAQLKGVPHRSIALRGASQVRCAARLTGGMHFSVSLGLRGKGQGRAIVRFKQDGASPRELANVLLRADEGFRDVTIPLDNFANELGQIEFIASETETGSRILFGDPELHVIAPAVSNVRAAHAVLVVMSNLSKAELTRGLHRNDLPTLRDLIDVSATFEAHRAPSTLAAASVASMLTALSPRVHGVTTASAALTPSTTLARIARDAGIRSAMFTGNPLTFRAFGFGEHWERFVEQSPASGDPKLVPIAGATAWLTEVADTKDARSFVALHVAAAHPPWDVQPKELAALPAYSGALEPRRAAQMLSRLRRKPTSVSPEDQLRIDQLTSIALRKLDQDLGKLIHEMKSRGTWEDALFIVTSDTASGSQPEALFGDGLPLDERFLDVPLFVRFPKNAFAKMRVLESTSHADVGQTIADALGVSFADRPDGRNLLSASADPRPLIAYAGKEYAVKWGSYVLRGTGSKTPTLCQRARDPECGVDVAPTHPIAARAMHFALAREHLLGRPQGQSAPAMPDLETTNALLVWGIGEKIEP